MINFSEAAIAHNHCKKSVEYALQVVEEFKDIKFVHSNVMKRE